MVILKTIFNNWITNDNTNRAAAIAFYTIFSFSPLLILSFNLASFFFDKDIVQREIISELSNLISPETVGLIQNIFNSSSYKLSSSLLSLLILFYASSKVFSVLRASFNKIFGLESKSHKSKILNFLEGQIISFILVPSTCLMLLASLFVNLVISKSDEFFLSLISDNYILINIFNHMISFLILVSISFLLIKFLPINKIPSKAALIGASVSAILFELGRFLITLYLSFSFIKGFYGSMGSLVVLMLWAYYSVQILLFGAELTQYLIQYQSKKTKINKL